MRKKQFVEDLVDGDQLDDLFLVKICRRGETRAGKPYLRLGLADRSGEIGGPAWENAEALEPICAVGAIVRVSGQVQTYDGRLQIQVKDVVPAEDGSWEPDDFFATSLRDRSVMQEELEQVISGVRLPHLRTLLKRIFGDGRTGPLFQEAPAAKGIHHAYLGGLLEHSLSMARVAGALADHYAGIDRDLLVTGALLHDIGKVEELIISSGVIDYTDAGRLKGHLLIGCEMIGRVAREIEGFPDELLTHLQHLVLSHHGRLEFGSPVVPMTAEALLLSFIDDMDAKMNLVEQLSRKVKAETPQWSEYQRSLERFLLLRPLGNDRRRDPDGVDRDSSIRQPRLF